MKIKINDDLYMNCPKAGEKGFDLVNFNKHCGDKCEYFQEIIGVTPENEETGDQLKDYRLSCNHPLMRRFTRIKL